jgi:hypothetical protein
MLVPPADVALAAGWRAPPGLGGPPSWLCMSPTTEQPLTRSAKLKRIPVLLFLNTGYAASALRASLRSGLALVPRAQFAAELPRRPGERWSYSCVEPLYVVLGQTAERAD